MAMGGGRHNMGYEIAGAAYDVALEHSRKLYPQIFQNFTVTHYFVPGLMTCQEAAAEAVTSLGALYDDKLPLSTPTAEQRHSPARRVSKIFPDLCPADVVISHPPHGLHNIVTHSGSASHPRTPVTKAHPQRWLNYRMKYHGKKPAE
ncbi:hypothetical protein RvY_11256 [Ramazzottius varieornatus]|uniref:Uncharacterized protein n=1 Tax=Ramazzottius varieornatus TaxID=947166 RepID=A0A1D1VN98_RAMVA|nr:hypothetical protein RvY_11256 [Ramazzottius varieornatus]